MLKDVEAQPQATRSGMLADRGSYDDFHFVDSGLCKCSSLVGVVWEVWNGLSFDPI